MLGYLIRKGADGHQSHSVPTQCKSSIQGHPGASRRGDTMLNNNYRDTRPSLSKKSTDSALEQFRQAVERMEQAILVPTRLMDLPLGDPQLRELTGENEATDLHQIYTTLRSLRDELNWTGLCGMTLPSVPESLTGPSVRSSGLTRHASTGSLASLVESSAYSSYGSNSDNDSLIGEEAVGSSIIMMDGMAADLADQFRRHVTGLHRTLERMVLMADYVTQRYHVVVGCHVD